MPFCASEYRKNVAGLKISITLTSTAQCKVCQSTDKEPNAGKMYVEHHFE